MRLLLLLSAALVLLVAGSLTPCEALSSDIRESFANNLEAKLGGQLHDDLDPAPKDDSAAQPKERGPKRTKKLRKARTLSKELRSAIRRIAPEIRKVAPMDMNPAQRMAAMEDVVKRATNGIAQKHGFSDFVLALEMLNDVTAKEKDPQIANHLREIAALIGAGEGTDPDMGHEIDEISADEATSLMRGVRDVLNDPSATLLLQTTASESKRMSVVNRLLEKVLMKHNFHELEDAIESATAAYQDSQDTTLAALMHDVGALLYGMPDDTTNVLAPDENEDEELDSVILQVVVL
jgi:hypothetical protein